MNHSSIPVMADRNGKHPVCRPLMSLSIVSVNA